MRLRGKLRWVGVEERDGFCFRVDEISIVIFPSSDMRVDVRSIGGGVAVRWRDVLLRDEFGWTMGG